MATNNQVMYDPKTKQYYTQAYTSGLGGLNYGKKNYLTSPSTGAGNGLGATYKPAPFVQNPYTAAQISGMQQSIGDITAPDWMKAAYARKTGGMPIPNPGQFMMPQPQQSQAQPQQPGLMMPSGKTAPVRNAISGAANATGAIGGGAF
jgi:hypothetical protein